MYIATIDGGTSNTRVFIWKDHEILGTAKTNVGVRDTAIEGSNAKLKAAVRDTLAGAACDAGISVADISLILAAGMITSKEGLIEIPHIAAPVSLDGLAGAMVSAVISDVAEQPIWFVPGVKNMADGDVTAETISAMDIMRGEEAEAAGLMTEASEGKGTVLVLPGSHNKYIYVDEKGIMQGCMTTLAGELLHSLTFDTILAGSVEKGFAEHFMEKPFLEGVDEGKRFGLGHGAFMTRVRCLFYGYGAEEARNYLLGLMLSDDVRSLDGNPVFAGADSATYVIAGKPVMQEAYLTLFRSLGRKAVAAPDSVQHGLSGRGAMALAKRKGLL